MDNWKTIMSFTSLQSANLVKNLLEIEEIPVVMNGEVLNQVLSHVESTNRIELLVPMEQYEHAVKLLKSLGHVL